MSSPKTVQQLFDLVVRSELLTKQEIEKYLLQREAENEKFSDASAMCSGMVRDHLLTHFQAKLLMQGRWKNFFLKGKYKVLEHLGAGGMGTVFLCEHRHMRRKVAIKVLPPDRVDSATLMRFQREAQAIAMLNHTNIVRAFDIEQEGSLNFLVMEYIDGVSMQHLVEHLGPLPIPRAVNYLCQAANGLQHAHQKGLVHRDIKPSNLMLDFLGVIKLLDLGLARFTNPMDNSEITMAGGSSPTVLGTADYLSPEQARDSTVDHRADIYSLGAVFYYFLTGQPPFHGGNVAMKLVRHQSEKPKRVDQVRSGIPVGIADVVSLMLEKSPNARPQQPKDVIRYLEPWLVDVEPPTPDEVPENRFSLNRELASMSKASTVSLMSHSGRTFILKTTDTQQHMSILSAPGVRIESSPASHYPSTPK
ncbi:MAG: serine/threonine-protein kinase [Zavarzinella sp.]